MRKFSDLFVRQFLDKPIASYTHTGNTEVAVTSIDTTADTFTKVGHGLSIGDRIFPIMNRDAGNIYPNDKTPGNITCGGSYYVIAENFTTDVFEVSTSLGGAKVDLLANANLNTTKWHFEKLMPASDPTIINLPSLQKCRLTIRGKCLYNGAGKYILPNSITPAQEWLNSSGTAYTYPNLNINGDISIDAEVIINYAKYLTIKAKGGKIASTNTTSNTSTQFDVIWKSLKYMDSVITSIAFNTFWMANSSVVEVYRA